MTLISGQRGMNLEPGKCVQFVRLHTGSRRGRRMMNVSYGRGPSYKKY